MGYNITLECVGMCCVRYKNLRLLVYLQKSTDRNFCANQHFVKNVCIEVYN